MSCAAEKGIAALKKRDAIKFTKIKVESKDAKNRIVLEYAKRNENGQDWDIYTMNSVDNPAPSFHEAMQELSQDVVELCELPDDFRERIVVKSVSLSDGDGDGFGGATITEAFQLKNSYAPLNLNTPYKSSAASGQEDPKQILDPATERRICVLIIEAEQFLHGSRAQVSMEFSEKQGVAA